MSSLTPTFSDWAAIIDEVRAALGRSECGNIFHCNLRCFCTHRACGEMHTYSYIEKFSRDERTIKSYHHMTGGVLDGAGKCSGHTCGMTRDVGAQHQLETLISSMKDQLESVQWTLGAALAITFETIVVKQLIKVNMGFNTKCEKAHTCTLQCLGCSRHRECFAKGTNRGAWTNLDHAKNCSLVDVKPNWQCREGHVCKSSSPNHRVLTELDEVHEMLLKLQSMITDKTSLTASFLNTPSEYDERDLIGLQNGYVQPLLNFNLDNLAKDQKILELTCDRDELRNDCFAKEQQILQLTHERDELRNKCFASRKLGKRERAAAANRGARSASPAGTVSCSLSEDD